MSSLDGIKLIPSNVIDCGVTSPPYWGLRDYGVEGSMWPEVRYRLFSAEIIIPEMECALGLESSPEAFIGHLILIFRELYRVMKPTATLWLNIGDSYCSTAPGSMGDSLHIEGLSQDKKDARKNLRNETPAGMKPKDLVGIPWMLAFALRADGWWLRQDIIWSKKNCMPESVTDRCTKSHEYIFLLSKSQQYYYDAEAIKVPAVTSENRPAGVVRNRLYDYDSKENNNPQAYMKPEKNTGGGKKHKNMGYDGQQTNTFHRTRKENGQEWSNESGKANKRSVWNVATTPYAEAHFATFPPELIVDCIKAGSSEHGCCEKCGKPWERMVESTKFFQSGSGKSGKDILGKNGMKLQGGGTTGDVRKGPITNSQTTGWQATCECGVGVVPAIVLDPFMGAGTTALVARKLSRDFVGFELNSKYHIMSENRLKKELGIFHHDNL